MKPPTQRILPTSPKTRVLGIMQDRSNSALADFPAFQILPEDIKKKQLESYKFVRATFPFYIPYAQHVMYLSRLDNRKGEYWGDASHFLLCNKAHGFPLWSELEKQIRSIDPPKVLCKPHISTKMANLILKHKFGQRQQVNQLYSHGSFLLAQLPFQPVLLFQWLTFMMRHVLMFELEMEEFYIMPVPVEFKPHLMSLHKLLKTTQRNIGFLFDYLQHQVESEPDIYVGNLKVFEIILNGVRAFLGFWQNHDGCKYVRNLKMKCWKHLDPDAELFQLKKGVMPLKKRNFLFNLDFWRGPSPKLTLFGNSNEQLVRIRPNKTHDEIWREVLKNKKINLEKIVDSFIIDCLEMPNVSFKFFMKRNGEFRELVQKVMHWSSGLAVEIRDRGIIGLVINLNTKIEYSHALFKTITWIEKKCKKSVNTLGNNWEQYYEFFDVDNIEPLITKLIGKPLRLQSDFEKLDPTVTAEPTHLLEFQYETRIQKIVLKCIKPHLEIKNYENEKDDVMRDWQVAQFLLPCFVSLFREISNSESPNDDLRVWYAKFLDKLIGTYEDKNLGFRKSSWKNILEDIEATPALKESYYEKNHQNLLNFFKRVSEDFYERIKICPTAFGHLAHCGYFRAFYEVLEKSCGENKTQSNDISTEPSVYWNWLMWDFFGRMDSAMQEATKQSSTDGEASCAPEHSFVFDLSERSSASQLSMGDDCGGDYGTSSSINEPSCSRYGSAESSLHQPSCSNQQPTTSDNHEDGVKHHSSADDVRSVIAAASSGVTIKRSSPIPSRRSSSSSTNTITNDFVVVPEVVEVHKVEKPNIMKSTTPPMPQTFPMPTVHNVVTFEDEIKKDVEWERKQKKKKEKKSKCCCS